MIHIFFGEMGSGKSHCGKQYAKENDINFFEGDSVLTPRMKERVSRFMPLTEDILAEYMTVLGASILQMMKTCNRLVVAQAIYSDSHRKGLKALLESHDYSVQMIWVKAPLLHNIRYLMTRESKVRWLLYWAASKPFFEKPTHDHEVLYNEP
jgi:gluconate kinase